MNVHLLELDEGDLEELLEGGWLFLEVPLAEELVIVAREGEYRRDLERLAQARDAEYTEVDKATYVSSSQEEP